MEDEIKLALIELEPSTVSISFKRMVSILKEKGVEKVGLLKVRQICKNGFSARDVGWGTGDGVFYRLPEGEDPPSVRRYQVAGIKCPSCGGSVFNLHGGPLRCFQCGRFYSGERGEPAEALTSLQIGKSPPTPF